MISRETSQSPLFCIKCFQIFDDTDTFYSLIKVSLDITSYFSGFFYEMISRVFTILIDLYLILHHCKEEDAGGEDFLGESWKCIAFSLFPHLPVMDEREHFPPYLKLNEEAFGAQL